MYAGHNCEQLSCSDNMHEALYWRRIWFVNSTFVGIYICVFFAIIIKAKKQLYQKASQVNAILSSAKVPNSGHQVS